MAFTCEKVGREQMSVSVGGQARRQAAKRILGISRKLRVSCHPNAGGGPPGKGGPPERRGEAERRGGGRTQ